MPGSSHSPRVVVAASSDIGDAVARHWISKGHRVCGTYREDSSQVRSLAASGAMLTQCDFTRPASTNRAARFLLKAAGGWDRLVLLAGTMKPIGAFESCDFESWSQSVQANFLGQMRLLRGLLPARARGAPLGPLIVFFSGSGSNSAPANLSAYTVSKIALTKMCELLDAEIPDVRTAIIGPGWIETKIHDEMLAAGPAAGEGYQRTVERLQRDEFVPMERVIAFMDWLENQPKESISGRNFSVPNDPWQAEVLVKELARDRDMYKLRRHRNHWKP